MSSDEDGRDYESLRLEYQLSQQMHTYYGRIVWQIGAIFLPVALAGFAFGMQSSLEKGPFVLLAAFLTALLVFFLFSYIRLRWLAFVHIKRCEELEQELGMKQHTLQHRANEKTIKIAGMEIKPQCLTGWHINVFIPLFLIALIWISVLVRLGNFM